MGEKEQIHILTEAEKESLKFMERDFNQCFQQMRHYDSQIIEIFKFMYLSYTGLIGIAIGLYEFGLKEKVNLNLAAIFALAVGLLLGIFLFGLIVRNRVYFVQVARYINEQRHIFFKYKALGFENKSRMYTNYTMPPFFNWRSSQSWFIYIVATLNATLLGILLFISISSQYRFLSILLGTISLFIVQLCSGIKYLKSRENKSAEKAVFGKDD